MGAEQSLEWSILLLRIVMGNEIAVLNFRTFVNVNEPLMQINILHRPAFNECLFSQVYSRGIFSNSISCDWMLWVHVWAHSPLCVVSKP